MKVIDRNLNYGRHIIEMFLVNSVPFAKVLDIGAGKGDDLNTVQKINKESKSYAVECYKPYVSELRSANIKVSQINIEKDQLPFDDESIDIIISNQVLEHIKEIFWVWHEISRVLTVRGKVIIGVPNLASLHNRLLLLLGRQPTPIQIQSAHVRGFTFPGFNKFLESCWNGGYKLIDFRGSNFYPFPPVIARFLSNIFPSFAWGIFMLYKKNRSYDNSFLKYPVENNLETNYFLG